jgi:hypothetical protein
LTGIDLPLLFVKIKKSVKVISFKNIFERRDNEKQIYLISSLVSVCSGKPKIEKGEERRMF